MPGWECLTGTYLHYRLLLLAFITNQSRFFRQSEPELPVCCVKLNVEVVSLVTDGRKSKLQLWTFVLWRLEKNKKNRTTVRCTLIWLWAAVSGSRHLGQVVKVIHRQLSVSLCLPLFNQRDNGRWQRSSAKYRLLAGHCCHGTGTSSAVGRTGGKNRLAEICRRPNWDKTNISRD